ncbi:hypothetical protein AXG93_1793s1080 [Marchantia polymorpha subsp. ruderalis]|uniref:Uncharacterized protein n=1 Tax=Marchantia polymorpha subsp. ruderalis TaxID=1480154 RepID=A0A176WGC6_MARPO|nr:hypothetical protein AXG93_1793s1080 [Marchantia polymorpha subsp. ruderalis]
MAERTYMMAEIPRSGIAVVESLMAIAEELSSQAEDKGHKGSKLKNMSRDDAMQNSWTSPFSSAQFFVSQAGPPSFSFFVLDVHLSHVLLNSDELQLSVCQCPRVQDWRAGQEVNAYRRVSLVSKGITPAIDRLLSSVDNEIILRVSSKNEHVKKIGTLESKSWTALLHMKSRIDFATRSDRSRAYHTLDHVAHQTLELMQP